MNKAALVSLLLWVLAACAPGPNASPVPTAMEPAISLTPTAPSPTSTPVPARPQPSATPGPTHTPTFDFASNGIPPGIQLPDAAIEILSPANGARLVSPVQIRSNLVPGAQGRIRIELLGEEGQSIARKILVWNLVADGKQLIETELAFEIEGVAEAGRLLISVDDEYGRLSALSSVDVTLLSAGPPEPSFSTDTLENALILRPEAGEALPSGAIQVHGIMRPRSERPLRVQIVARDGRVLAFASVYPTRPEGYEYAVFSITLNAEVDNRQPVLISVLETGEGIPGDVHLYSHEFTLTP